jgi:thymidylate synthase
VQLGAIVDLQQLSIEDSIFRSGLPPASTREAKWEHFGKTAPETTYGYHLYTKDRLARAVSVLLTDKHSRSAHIQIDDLPGRQPCATSFNLAIRNNALITTVTFRSMDAIDGYPYDAILFWNHVHLAAIEQLKELKLNIDSGEMVFFVTSFHLYIKDAPKLINL